jgi:ATP-binding cassette subfamily A (ABC1) protein 3
VLYFILTFVAEWVISKRSIASAFTRERSVKSPPVILDDDVEEEMSLVERTPASDYSIKVDKLRKVFLLDGGKAKVAVDKSSFGVKNGDCFALLGVNGAGKTTTFKMLSGEIIPTEGEAIIKGHDISKQLGEARKYIGYCPQFDALLDNLTAKEHLFLYAAIKGIPTEKRADVVEKMLVEMDLKKYENIRAGTYSGGNKRKLSVAMAIIGNPPIVFLDEPSTGMDPEARRFMWEVIRRISQLRKQSSIILTTHMMDEAENLSTRLAIMVDGNFKCMGSTQHIKSKYGGGYELEVKLNPPPKDALIKVITDLGFQPGQLINRGQVTEIFKKLNAEFIGEQINEKGSGSELHIELQRKNVILVDHIVTYFLIENLGNMLFGFLSTHFGQVGVIEHFHSFYRFKILSQVSIGKIFGTLEDNKDKLQIVHYSVKQTTIEQIFNMFAQNQIKVEEYKKIKSPTPVVNNEVKVDMGGSPNVSKDAVDPLLDDDSSLLKNRSVPALNIETNKKR